MFHRLLNPLESASFFLFGARGTGKTTFLRQWLGDRGVLWIDLLDADQEGAYQLDPMRLERAVAGATPEWVVVDEIQKAPRLLDVVHRLVEARGVRFALTGSSARKLKAGQADMLAGRACLNHLFPLTFLELGERFSLDECLNWGSLPHVFALTESERAEYLRSYTQVYLKEEVWGEHLIRKLEPFRKFLPVAARVSGQILNASQVARDVGCDVKTVQSYFEILEDTLLGFTLGAFHTSVRRSISAKPKFYLFDLGVQRALARLLTVPVAPRTSAYGDAFEQFIILECLRLNAYFRKDYQFSYLRTKDDAEIDLVVERPGRPLALLELKSTTQVQPARLRRFLSLSRDFRGAACYCLSQDPLAQRVEHVVALPWQRGLKELFELE